MKGGGNDGIAVARICLIIFSLLQLASIFFATPISAGSGFLRGVHLNLLDGHQLARDQGRKRSVNSEGLFEGWSEFFCCKAVLWFQIFWQYWSVINSLSFREEWFEFLVLLRIAKENGLHPRYSRAMKTTLTLLPTDAFTRSAVPNREEQFLCRMSRRSPKSFKKKKESDARPVKVSLEPTPRLVIRDTNDFTT